MEDSRKVRDRSGFTLVELVVVIAILGILAGVGYAGYSGYVEYAQKGADRKLVGEIQNAVSLAVQTDESAPLTEGEDAVAIGTIFISHPDTNIPSSVYDSSGILESALTDTYGSDYMNALKLKYDGWHTSGAGASGFITEDGDRYLNAQQMMDTLYGFADSIFTHCADGYATYGQGNAQVFNLFISCLNGEDGKIDDILKQAGVDGGIQGANQKNMRNAAIWALADYISEDREGTKKAMTDLNALEFNANSMISKLLGQMLDPNNNVDDMLSEAVRQSINSYVSLNMLVAYLSAKDPDIATDFNATMAKLGTVTPEKDYSGRGRYFLFNLAELINDAESDIKKKLDESPELQSWYDKYYEGGENSQANKDIDAYIDIASNISGLQDKYNTEGSLDDEESMKYFTGEDFVNEISRMTGESSGIMITAKSDGSCVVDPIDASPMKK